MTNSLNIQPYKITWVKTLLAFIAFLFLLTNSLQAQEVDVFTSSGTFTVPDGVTEITVELWGGGGNGGIQSGPGNNRIAGGGGGGGAYTRSVPLGVTPGDVLTIVVGAGGSPTAVDGETTFITRGETVLISANGGKGVSNSPTRGDGGAASTGANVDASEPGGNGSDATDSSNSGAGGAGGGDDGGAGGAGVTSNNTNGNGGSAPGGGGSGATGNGDGGAGARGEVRISYTVSTVASFEITGAQSVTAGAEEVVTITAVDSEGDTEATYSGTKSLTFSGALVSPNGTAPVAGGVEFGTAVDVEFSSGIATVPVSLFAAETATVSVSDGSASSAEDDRWLVTVSNAGFDALNVDVGDPRKLRNQAFDITVSLVDEYGNQVLNTGSSEITLTSNKAGDPAGQLELPVLGSENDEEPFTATIEDGQSSVTFEGLIYTGVSVEIGDIVASASASGGTADGITGTRNFSVRAASLSVTADPSTLFAKGTTTLTARYLDEDPEEGNDPVPVEGIPVRISIEAIGQTNQINDWESTTTGTLTGEVQFVDGVTDANGEFTTELTASGTPGDIVVRAQCPGTCPAFDLITVLPGTANENNSSVTASPLAVASNGNEESTITVTLRDASNDPIEGQTVRLTQELADEGTSSAAISDASLTTNADGVAVFTATNNTTEVVRFRAVAGVDEVGDGEINVTQSVDVVFAPPLSLESAITTNDGTAVRLTFNEDLTDPAGEEDSFTLVENGIVRGFESAELDGSRVIRLKIEGDPISAGNELTITYIPGDVRSAAEFPLEELNNVTVDNLTEPPVPSAEGSTLLVSPEIIRSGFVSVATVQVKTADGTAITEAGIPVTLSVSSGEGTLDDGTNTGTTISGTTDEEGRYSAVFIPPVVTSGEITSTISATLDGDDVIGSAIVTTISEQVYNRNSRFVKTGTEPTIPIDGDFTGWGEDGTFVINDKTDRSNLNRWNIDRLWMAFGTEDGSLSSADNPITDVFFRVDHKSANITTDVNFNIQLNLTGDVQEGKADHLLRMLIRGEQDNPQVRVALFRYDSPVGLGVTTGSLTAVYDNLGEIAETGPGTPLVAIATEDGTGRSGIELRLPFDWLTSVPGSVIKDDGSGMGVLTASLFTSTGAFGSVGTMKDILEDINGNTIKVVGSLVTGAVIFFEVDTTESSLTIDQTSVKVTGVDSEASALITATIKDSNDNLISDLNSADFLWSNIGNAEIEFKDNVGEGVYEFVISNSTAQSLDIELTIGIYTLENTISVQFLGPIELTVNNVITNSSTPVITGTSDLIGGTVTVTINGESYTGTVEEDGTWSVDVTDELEDGEYDFTASITDEAGNETSKDGSLSINTQNPVVSVEDPNGSELDILFDEDEEYLKLELMIIDPEKQVGTFSSDKDVIWSLIDFNGTGDFELFHINEDGVLSFITDSQASSDPYVFIVRATDVYGNITDVTVFITVSSLIIIDEDRSFTDESLSPDNLFSDQFESLTIVGLPTRGSLKLGGVIVEHDQIITRQQVEEQGLTFDTSEEDIDNNRYGYNYDSITFMQGNTQTTIRFDLNANYVKIEQEGWYFLTSPKGQKLGEFLEPVYTQGYPGSNNPSARFPNVYFLDQENYDWYPPVDSDDIIQYGQTVIVYIFGDNPNGGNTLPVNLGSGKNWLALDGSFIFSSGENSDFPISFDENQGEQQGESYSLVANPHAIAIDVCEILGVANNLASNYYIWDLSLNDGHGGYKTISCDPMTQNENGMIETDRFVQPFQGFWIRTTADNPSFPVIEESYVTYSAQFESDQRKIAQITEQKVGPSETSAITLKTINNENVSYWDEIKIVFHPDGTLGLDAFDAPKLSSSGFASRYLETSAIDEQGLAYSIMSLPMQLEEDLRIGLRLQTTEAGEFTLKWNTPNTEYYYYLRDTFYDKSVKLTSNGEYLFKSEATNMFKQYLSAPPGLPEKPEQAGEKPRFELIISKGLLDFDGLNPETPKEISLQQNYPNPFNPTTQINYTLPQQSDVRLDIFDMTGRHIATLVNGQVAAGSHTVTFDGSNLSSGVYIYRLSAGGQVFTRQLTLIK